MYSPVDLNRDARLANREVDTVSANLVLSHDVNTLVLQFAKHGPSASFTGAHAVASFGVLRARRTSQMPSAIIGKQSSMPMVR